MKLLLDECVPHRLRNYLPGHECQSAQYAGFRGLENGDLPRAAEAAKFDAFLTVDRGIEYEQNLSKQKIAIVILHGKSTRLKDLIQLTEDCLEQLKSIQPGQIIHVG